MLAVVFICTYMLKCQRKTLQQQTTTTRTYFASHCIYIRLSFLCSPLLSLSRLMVFFLLMLLFLSRLLLILPDCRPFEFEEYRSALSGLMSVCAIILYSAKRSNCIQFNEKCMLNVFNCFKANKMADGAIKKNPSQTRKSRRNS